MKFLVRGGRPLKGEVKLAGSKNAATKLMLATLLSDEPSVLSNFPDIGDTAIAAELCRDIGSEITQKGGLLAIATPDIRRNKVLALSRRNRIPILALGPLLARTGEAEVPIVGGDKIGPRPVDFHIGALRALGAEIETTPQSYAASAPHGLRGAEIKLDFPSVGATEQVILAAVLARGETSILNAALEPEIMSLVRMLQKMGAIIELGANRDIHIQGVERLCGIRHDVPPDRNEAVSFACLAVATSGDVLVRGAIQENLITFLNVVRKLGAEYEVRDEGIRFWRPNSLKALDIETAPHPGFMTDWQQPLAVLLTQAKGVSRIHETIWEDRFGYAEDLNALGARIAVSTECPAGRACRFKGKGFRHAAAIEGPTPLEADGKALTVRDLRAGMIDIIAALVSEGETEIDGIEEIDRGYERIDERLRELGADITRKQ